MGIPGVGTTIAWHCGSLLQAALHPFREMDVEKGSGPGTVGRTQFTPAWRTHWPPTTCGSVYTVHHGCLEGGLHLVRLTQPLR